ncbi:MAG TPA: DUF4160 domain-containing protein [Devosia sp.]|nr:DUF4160 domain-containing protein [Devosia sp.]
MPALFREGRVLIRLFDRDHQPPHCHVSTSDGDVQVSLDSLTIINGDIRTQDYEVARRIISDNIAFLREEWTRRNG